MKGLFVTGTDTDVGKTYWAAAILRSLVEKGHRVGAYKPVCSGAIQPEGQEELIWSDIEMLSDATNREFAKNLICPQAFKAAFAPPVAAEFENATVDENLLKTGFSAWDGRVDGMIVEGVGGWKSPISGTMTVEHLAQWIGFPVVIVAGQKLGAINQTLLTIESVQRCGLSVAGVILNQNLAVDCQENSEKLLSNAEQICKFAEIPFLAIAEFNHDAELRCFHTSASIDWWELMSNSDSTSG